MDSNGDGVFDNGDNLLGALMQDNFPLAYVKPVNTEKGCGYGVYAADGTQLAVFGSREAAFYAAKQHDLEPVLIH